MTMDVRLHPDARLDLLGDARLGLTTGALTTGALTTGALTTGALTTVQRTCFNIRGLDPTLEEAHLKRLYLVPRQANNKKKRPGMVEGYSCATRLQGGVLAVPRFYGSAHFGPAQEDRTTLGDPTGFTFTGTLLPYQESSVSICTQVMRRVGGALLCAGCGTGKTVMAIAVAARLGVRTAVLVHKQFLLEQWRARFAQFAPGARVGVVAQSTNDLAGGIDPDVVICMIQTVLSRHGPAVGTFARVGLVVCDECHHVCAQSFMRALLSFPARYRLGLTATPRRRDGLGFALPWILGPLAVEVKRACARVDVCWLTGTMDLDPVRDTRGELLYAATVSRLVACRRRNARVLACVASGLRHGRQIIVISERRGHLEELCSACGTGSPSLYLGETRARAKQERDERAVTANPLFASYSLSAEALDIPRLDMLVFASPRGAPACIEQCVGRIMRAFPGKPTPLVVDFRDSLFVSMARERRGLYRRESFRQRDLDSVDMLFLSASPAAPSCTR